MIFLLFIEEFINFLCVAIHEMETLGKLHINIQHVTKQLIDKMGGICCVGQLELRRNKNIRYLVVDRENLKGFMMEDLWRFVKTENEENGREIMIVDNKWVSDCYFNMCWIEPSKYRIMCCYNEGY